eukprot:GDKK01016680.1.p1 GENE.GDKK01016680.1~~GDKK01016680.1.p1  ORF type:complete len:209 (-),score=16.23 GDKK01016680.1:22-648(-)
MTCPLLLLIPGQLPVSEFTTTSPTQLVADVPHLAPSICITVIPELWDQAIAPGSGIGVYVTDYRGDSASSANGGANFHFLGFLSVEQPSLQPRMPATMDLASPAQFGFSIDSISNLKNLTCEPERALQTTSQMSTPSVQKIAKSILSNLYTFVTSYSKSYSSDSYDAQSEENVYLPSCWEQLWYNKFVMKKESGAYTGDAETPSALTD